MIPYHLSSLRLATERRLKEERGNETDHWPHPPPPSSVLPFFFLPHITTLSPFWLSKKNIRNNVLLPRSVKQLVNPKDKSLNSESSDKVTGRCKRVILTEAYS